MKSKKILSAVLVICLLFTMGAPVLNVYAEESLGTRKAIVAMEKNTVTVTVGDAQVMSAVTKDKSITLVKKEDGRLSVRYNDTDGAAKGIIVGGYDTMTLDGEFASVRLDSTLADSLRAQVAAGAVIGTLRLDGTTPVTIYGSVTLLQVNGAAKLAAYPGAKITEAEMKDEQSNLTIYNGATLTTAYTQYPYSTLTGRANIGRISGPKAVNSAFSGSSTSRSRRSSGGNSGSNSGGNQGGGDDGDGGGAVIPGDFALEVLQSSFEVGDQGKAIFRAIYDGEADQVSLVDQDGAAVADLLDDGNIKNGDDILADGVYSAVVQIDTTKDAAYTFYAQVGDEVSNTVTVSVYSLLSDEILQQVEDTLVDMNDAFAAMNGDKTQFVNYLHQLEASGAISGVTTSDPGLATFEFAGGILGGYLLEPIEKNLMAPGNGWFSADDDDPEEDPPKVPEAPEDDPDLDPTPDSIPGNDPDQNPGNQQNPAEDPDLDEDPTEDEDAVEENGEEPGEAAAPEPPESISDILGTIDTRFRELIKELGGNNDQAKEAFLQYLQDLEAAQVISDLQQSENDSNMVFFDRDGAGYRYHMVSSVGKVNLSEPEILNAPVAAKAAAAVLSVANTVNNVGNNRVLLISTLPPSDPMTNGYQVAMQVFEGDKYGFVTKSIFNATVDDYRSLRFNGVILNNSHGLMYRGAPSIVMEERANMMNKKAYNEDLKAKRLAIVGGEKLEEKEMVGQYLILPKFIEDHYSNSKLSNSLVYLGNCWGHANDELANAFLKAGAGAVSGYTRTVSVGYDTDILTTMVGEFCYGSTIEEAWQEAIDIHGTSDPTTAAIYSYSGNSKLTVVNRGIVNGGFEMFVPFTGWYTMGDTRIINGLASLKPPEGSRMAIISTGLGAANDSNSIITQNLKVPLTANTLSFTYNVISEEPPKWIGSVFDDTFIARLMDPSGNELELLAMETVNQSEWFYIPDIDFYGGDDTAYETKWKTVEVDITPYRGQNVVLHFWVYDRGDSNYDTAALIDDVKIL